MSPSDPNKTVFISYRRKVSSFIARAIFLDLRANGYDVFMDVESIDSGTFDTIILNQIAARAHFLVILTPGTLNRCVQEGDWLRKEIEYAMEQQRNIVPVLCNDFKFSSKIKQYLTGELEGLSRLNALTLPHEYFDAGMEKLRNRFLKQPTSDAILTPTPAAEQTIVAEKIEETARQPRPTDIELSAEDYFVRALAKGDTDNWDGAIEDYTEAIQLNPDYSEAYINRGNARLQLRDMIGAMADYNKAIELKPEDADVYNNRGITRRQQGDMAGAIIDCNKAIELKPNLAEAYNNRGITRRQQQDITEALFDYNKAIELKPDYAEAYNNRGVAWTEEGHIAWALADYDKAIELKPDYAEAYNNRGNARDEQGDATGAMADYDKAIELRPDYTTAYINRGVARRQQKDVMGALADYSKAIELKPDFAEAYNNRGFARGRQGDIVGAMADYDKAIQLKPDLAEVYYNRADLFFLLQHFEKALDDFKKAMDLGLNHPIVVGCLAITYHAMGQIDEAKMWWRRLIRQDMRYRDLEWVRKELDGTEALVEEARKLIARL